MTGAHPQEQHQQALKFSTLRWSAGLSVAFVLLATLLIWWNLRQAASHHLHEDLDALANAVARETEAVFNERVNAIDRMGEEWESLGGIPPKEWDRDAEITARNLTGIQGIALADPDGRILRILPHQGNEKALGFVLSSEPRRREALERAKTSRHVALSSRIELAQGGEGLLVVRALHNGDRHTGYISAAFRFTEIMRQINARQAPKGHVLSLIYEGNPVYESAALSTHTETITDTPLRIANGQWQLRLRTSPHALKEMQSTSHGLVLLGGTVLALLLAAMFLFWLRALRQQFHAGELQMRWQFAIEGSGLGLWDWDAESGKVYFSPRWKSMLGYEDGDIGDSLEEWEKRTHPDDKARVDEALAAHFRGEAPMYECEHRMLCKDGSYKWILDRGMVMTFGADGKPLRMLGTHADISKRKQAELALEEQKRLLQQVLDNQSVATFMIDTQHRVMHWNRACEQITGIQARDIIGTDEAWRGFYGEKRPLLADMLLDSDYAEMSAKYVSHAQSSLTPNGWHAENWLTDVHGKRRYAMFDAAPIIDASGKMLAVIETLQDITEQKISAMALDENARFIQAILDSASDTIITIDQYGIIQSVNHAAERTFGYKTQEMVGHNVSMLMDDTERSQHDGHLLRYAKTGRPQAIGNRREVTARHKDGSCFPISLGVSELIHQDRRLFIGMIHDISQEKRIQQELREGKETAQQALHALEMQQFALDQHAIVAITDTDGNITYANQRFCDISGYTREELLGQNHRIVNSGHHPQSFFSELYQTVSKGEVWQGEICNRNKNGALYWVNTTIVPFLGVDGRPQQYIAIRTDITERKRNEEELARHRDHLEELVADQTAMLLAAKEAAEQANMAKSEFLANMSHELRTPMHAILSFSELGEQKSPGSSPDKLAGYFTRIHASGERLLLLLNDLLDLSKLEAGMMLIEAKPNDLLGMLLEILAELDGLIQNKQLQIHLQPVECETVCEFDAPRIGKVLRNLLSNAIKFTPEQGTLDIRILDGEIARGRRAVDTEKVPAIVLEVHDTGIGIPPDELDAIFDKFIQSSKTKSGAGGTGLGLAICTEIVEAHRGTITATNNAHGGATFTVTLPRSHQAAQETA